METKNICRFTDHLEFIVNIKLIFNRTNFQINCGLYCAKVFQHQNMASSNLGSKKISRNPFYCVSSCKSQFPRRLSPGVQFRKGNEVIQGNDSTKNLRLYNLCLNILRNSNGYQKLDNQDGIVLTQHEIHFSILHFCTGMILLSPQGRDALAESFGPAT